MARRRTTRCARAPLFFDTPYLHLDGDQAGGSATAKHLGDVLAVAAVGVGAWLSWHAHGFGLLHLMLILVWGAVLTLLRPQRTEPFKTIRRFADDAGAR